MKMKTMKTVVRYLLVLPLLFLVSSCSDEDYLNVIPDNSTALVAIDAQKLFDGNVDGVLGKALNTDGIDKCGIDFLSKIYLFETFDGNIGVAAKVSNSGDLEDFLNSLSKKGICKGTVQYEDFKFTVIKDTWVAGFSSDALVVMGPSLPAVQAETKRQIVKLLNQDEEHGIKNSPMFEKMESIEGAVAVVAQASALPEKLAAPFTLGAPKDADLSQIMIAADLKKNGEGCILIDGETFSFNKSIDEKLKKSREAFRPIKDSYVGNMSRNSVWGAFMNVDGKVFINMLHANKAFQALLAGMNMAIDMDKIIKSIDGDVVLASPNGIGEGEMDMVMCARISDKAFLADVDYWKRSCPAGSKITDWRNNAFCYTNGDMSYYFGVTDDMQFYSASTEVEALNVLSESETPLPEDIQELIKGKRFAVVFNVGAYSSQSGQQGGVVKTLLGETKTILYVMK